MKARHCFSYPILLFFIITIVCYPLHSSFASSVDSYGKSYRELLSKSRVLEKEESLDEQAKLQIELYQYIEYFLTQPYSDDSLRENLNDSIQKKDTNALSKTFLKLSFTAVEKALNDQDYVSAKAWYDIREEKFKFDKQATAGLKAMVELENTPEKVETLAPIIINDLVNTYLFKLKESMTNGDYVNAYYYFEIVEHKLKGELDIEDFQLIQNSLSEALENPVALSESKLQSIQNSIAEYSLKDVSEEDVRNQIKKITTLLDYVSRNWNIAIQNGQVFNGVEFAELKAFIKDAKQRFLEIESRLGDKSGTLNVQLSQAESDLLNKQNAENAIPNITSLIENLAEFGGISDLNDSKDINYESPEESIAFSIELLNKAKSAYEGGNQKEANDFIFEAYFAFEPLETKLTVKNNQIVQDIELLFNEIRSKIQSGKDIDQPFLQLIDKLNEAITIISGETSGWGLFLQSLLIILREGFEAILVISALVAYLRKTGHKTETKYIYYGALSAIVASFASAYLIRSILKLSGANQEVLEGITMLIAVVVLFYVSYWLISKSHADKWHHFIEGKLQQSIGRGNLLTMGFVSFLAVYREGFETILFYQALLAIGDDNKMIIYGFIFGCFLLILLYLAIARFSIRIPIKPFFLGTSMLLYILAFSFAGNGIFELQEGGVISSTFVSGVPTLPIVGLFPTIETLAAQSLLIIALFIAIFALLRKKTKPSIVKEGV